ncbi:MAG: peptidoglycan-binding domain-containing protein [Candidatus Paceibacterota bacterium]|jgi:hypothetical protein
MKNTLLSVFAFSFLTVILLTPGGVARAANPSVSSFSVSPLSVSSGQPINISWTLADAGGHSLLISCQQAIVVRKIDGSIFPCGTRTSISAQASDATTITVSNVSGVLKQLTISLIPKDGAGVDYDAAQQSETITVGANQNTITSFTVATSTPSGATTTISWVSATDVPAANLIIGCATSDVSVVALSLGAQPLPCGVTASSGDLSASGSLELLFTNQSPLDISIQTTIIPAIVYGSYDAIHGLTKTILVQGKKTIEPAVISFTASSTKMISGGTSVLSWTTQNASGVNIKFSCNENVSTAKIVNQATTTVACGNFIFDQPLTATNATVMLTNMTNGNQTVTVSLLPANINGTYSGLQQKDISLTVLGMGVTALPITNQTVTPVAQTPAIATTTSPATGCAPGHLFSTLTGQACPTILSLLPAQSSASSAAAKKSAFTKPMSRGVTGTEVRTLQQFFAKYPEIYGKVTVNGIFGPATQKLVMKFQEKYGIAKKGSAGYGLVGPATRTKLNSLQ